MKNNVAIYEDFPKHLYGIKANFSVQVYQSEQEQTCTYEIPIENHTHRIELQKLYPWNEDLQAFTDFGDLSLRIHIGAEEQFGIQSVGELISRIFGMDSKIANQIPIVKLKPEFNLGNFEQEILSEISEDLNEEPSRIIGRLLTDCRVLLKPEMDFKIRELAKYHEMGIIQLMTHLVTSAYIEAENAGLVPVDPWNRNPNPEFRDANELSLFHSFPEFLRDFHISHSSEYSEDEDQKQIEIQIPFPNSESDSKAHRYIKLCKYYAWDDDAQAFVPGLDDRLVISAWDIGMWSSRANRKVNKGGPLKGIKTLEQLARKVGLTI